MPLLALCSYPSSPAAGTHKMRDEANSDVDMMVDLKSENIITTWSDVLGPWAENMSALSLYLGMQRTWPAGELHLNDARQDHLDKGRGVLGPGEQTLASGYLLWLGDGAAVGDPASRGMECRYLPLLLACHCMYIHAMQTTCSNAHLRVVIKDGCTKCWLAEQVLSARARCRNNVR